MFLHVGNVYWIFHLYQYIFPFTKKLLYYFPDITENKLFSIAVLFVHKQWATYFHSAPKQSETTDFFEED